MGAFESLDKTQDKLFNAVGDVNAWCESEYESKFSEYFNGIPELYAKVQASQAKLTDEELEWILTSAPLQLISVSEELSKYKLNSECLKLYTKKIECDVADASSKRTVTEKKDEAAKATLDYKMLNSAYGVVIDRVENQINFTRELIMSAKKIWDSRVKTYNANPVSELDGEEPLKTYVR